MKHYIDPSLTFTPNELYNYVEEFKYSSEYKRLVNLEKYYKALEAYICTLSTYDKMPSDSTFNEGLHYKNMYKKSRVLRYFFDIIENDNKEPEVTVVWSPALVLYDFL